MIDENLIPVNELVPIEKIPDELGFIKDCIEDIIADLFVGDYVVQISVHKEYAFYSFKLLSFTRIGFEFPNTNGLTLILNPGINQTNWTEFPVSLAYSLPILKYVNTFDSDNFDFSPRAFFDILIAISNTNRRNILETFINSFYEWDEYEYEEEYEEEEEEEEDDEERSPLEKFVDDFNTNYTPTTPLVISTDEETDVIEDLLLQMESNGNDFDIIEIIFTDYIIGEDIDESISNIIKLFRYFIGDFTIGNITSMLIPEVSVSLDSINIALEFPRNILQPINEQTGEVDEDEDKKSRLLFEVGSFYFSSRKGFDFENLSSFNFPKSQIGNTGFTLEFTNAKIDLSDSTNIPEAEADGRTEFKGVYIEEATIGLPKDWADNSTGVVEIKGKELLIGTDGGFSGKIGVEGNGNLKFSLLGIDIDFTSFYVEFKKNAVISSDIKGKLTIEGLKDSKGDDAVLDFTIDWNENGYTIKFENTNGIQLKVPNVVDITLYSLSIGRTDGKWHFSSKGKIDRVADIPKIGAIIPRTLDFKKFEINQGAANDYDIDIKWENDITTTFPKSGLSVDEEHVFPINKTFLKIFTLHLMKFKASGNVQDGADLSALIDADLNLDPIFGTIRGGGLKAAITFPENGGNLGPADIRFSLVTPDSMGIQIKIPGIKGGGWLKKDENEEEYAGLLHLEIQDKLKITAYGILNLRLPNGNAGFSIVGIASVEFTPAIDIAMGLKLGGIGVLFGLNRSMDITALQDSVRDNTLQHLMFPEKPVENASTIISTMGKVFPVNEGQFTFGLLLKAYWGGEKLVTLTMGIMVEVKNPVKIAVAGVLTLSLPDEKNPLVLINAAFLAAVDFEVKKFLLDAKIYDSKIMNASVSGDILARYYWGENSGFLLSIGGFHPSYTPPQMDLPAKINRLAISFINEADKWLKGEFYMAVTSNSVQFGAAVDLYVKITGKYVLKGNFNLDVLVYTKPEFSFMAQMHISAGVYRNSKQLAGVKIDLSLQGPNPYIATGRGSFSVGKLTISANFDVQTKTKKTVIQATANVFEQVVAQFEQEYSWMMVLQDSSAPQVSIADMSDQPSESSPLLLHPMGGLEIKQGVAPLGVKLASFGNARIEAQTPDNIWVAGIKIQGDTVPFTHAEDKFAPGQFFTLSEQEKLKSPSFSNYRAGIRVGSTGKIDTSCIRERSATHETKIIDRSFDYPTRHDNINTAHFDMSLQGNATAVSGISSGRNTQKSSLDSAEDVKIEQEKYHVVFTDTFSDANSGLTFGSFQAAEDSLTTLLASLQLDTTDLIVVRESEYEILID
ncbi:MAG: hypothetical protein M9892_05220 [Bacteroidetes bacterium]|nr:hypothetical protein [Bacteroidota bacterium]